jgi:site-specific DNA-cytosine methylase
VKFLDFFAGIGGFRLGLERAGHQCVGACEIAKAPRKVYKAQFGHEPEWSDIRGIQAKDLPQADCWVGGFPCQDLSSAGTCAGIDGERSGLVWDLLRLAADVRPDWIVLENVDGALVRGRGWGRLPRALADLGYVGSWRTLDARIFAVAQRRSRVFLLARRAGARGGCPGELLLHPADRHRDLAAGDGAGPPIARAVTTRVGGRRDPSGDTLIIEGVYGFNGWTGCTGDVPLLDAVPTLAAGRRAAVLFSGTSTARNSGRLTDYASCQTADGHHPSSGQGGTVIFAPEVSPPLLASAGKSRTSAAQAFLAGRDRHGPFVRMLTVTECERVMGFPDGWTKAAGKDTPRRRCLGNAVVPNVIEWIGRRLAASESLPA